MANLVCRFGSEVLLDRFDEIVYPSFFNKDLSRNYSDTAYFFEKVSLLNLDSENENPTLGIAGRLIKDTSLTRQQVYVKGKGLVKDKNSIQSSPSALFLLILNNHRLIYIKETVDAPSLDTFRSTLLFFLRKTYSITLKEQLDKVDSENITKEKKSIKKNEIREKFQQPTLELIPLTSKDSIESFISKYELLSQVTISFSDRNDENDLDDFFLQMQKQKEKIGSDSSALVHKSKEGLDKEQAVAQVTAATAQGNQSVTLRGKDNSGDVLVGNNDKFQLKRPIGEISPKPDIAAIDMYEAFTDLAKQGIVLLPVLRATVVNKIKKIYKDYFNE